MRARTARRGCGIWKRPRDSGGPPAQGIGRDVALGAGETVLTASTDRTVKQWSLTGTLLHSLEEHRAPIVRATFDLSGTRVATAGTDGRVCLHDLASEALEQCLVGHRAGVTAVQFAPSGKLFTGSIDGTVRVWQGDAREFTSSHAFRSAAGWFTITRDGTSVLASDGHGSITSFPLDRGPARWSVAAHGPGQSSIDLSIDDRSLLTVNGSVKLWQVATGTLEASLEPPAGTAYEHAVLLGDQYVVATASGSIELHPRGSAGPPRTIGEHRGVTTLTLSPDNGLLVSGSSEHTLQLFDTATWTHRATLRGHTGDVYEVVFSPDGRASRRRAAMARSGSGRAGRALHVLLAKNAGLLLSPRFDRAGRRLFTAHEDGGIRVWDTTTGALVTMLKGHDSQVGSLAVSPAGDLLVSGGWDGGVALWDLERLRSVMRWRHTARVSMVKFAPDGHAVVSASADRTLKVWPVDDGGSSLADELALIRRAEQERGGP